MADDGMTTLRRMLADVESDLDRALQREAQACRGTDCTDALELRAKLDQALADNRSLHALIRDRWGHG